MKKTLAVLFAASAALTISAQSIIRDGDFEKMDGWGIALHKQDFASIKQVTDDVKEGKTALKFEFTQTPKVYICISQHINLKPEYKVLKASVKYKAPEGGGLLFLFCKSSSKAINLPPTKEWTTAELQLPIPSGDPSGRIEIRFTKQGFMLIDDVAVTAVTEQK